MSFDFRHRSTSLAAMVLVSFLLQVAAIAVFHTYKFRLADNHFGFGWEMGRIGKAIAEGKGFSNPYGPQTGPTAWEPPVYPYLIGGVFKVFGIYSNASAWVLLTINSLFSALTCIPIFLIARHTMGEKVAVWSGWTWALFPYVMYWSVHWIWDTTLSPLLLSLIFFTALRLGESGAGWRWWAAFGMLWGATALANPSCLSFLPFCLVWIWRRLSLNRRSVLGIASALIVMAICVTPWLARNYVVFGRLVFIRDDFGLQLRLGNGPSADGVSRVYLQPNLNGYELERFRRLGELPYAEACQREAVNFIREHPGRFVVLSAKRFVYYWAGAPKPDEGPALTALRSSLFLASSVLALWGVGRALRKRKPAAWLFVLLLLSYPAVYYFVYPHARYRHVIEPELLILAVFLVSEAERKGVRKQPLENKKSIVLSPSQVEAPKHSFRERMARTSVAGIALWGFAVRVACIFVMHTYKMRTWEDNFSFGFETGRIARALVLGQGFSNPFHGITGPTSWEAPVYPYVVAGVFQLTGIYTRLSAVLILTFNSFFSALTVLPLYLIAKKLFGLRVARWAAWTWALFPYAIHWAVRWVWETSLAAFLLTTVFWLALEISEAHGRRLKMLWAGFGLLWGVTALTNPSCLIFLPFAGGWACYRLWRQSRPWFLMATASALLFFVVIAPWEVRNYRLFHQFIPIRGNGGAELRLGNGPGAVGLWMLELHPTRNVLQLQLYREMGEVAYVKMRQQEAVEWMRAHPGRTAVLWLKKAIYYWAGVPNPSANWLPVQGKNSIVLAWAVLAWWGVGRMIRLRKRATFLFATLLVAYPVVYYITFPQLRYRHPIEPVMMILAVYVISEARELRESAASGASAADS